ncbi:MAG: UDP-N-acetylmuramate:L-alanyl-gamma-D-glutamyl-meso-diaminopimelate ligase, partial [Gammaproteobacteria bacterium]|nr:UDP-N-acetylmuramate:L-alanyl-gamma-D-glutamyl-meso-diaminopimelate ligase [Gammaproteobacteria bacterium]
ADWHVADCAPDGSSFDVICETHNVGTLQWSLSGRHNISNALAALAAARHAGVPPSVGIEALARFENVKRRMELRGEVGGVRVFDDFAHHPTAIRTTLDGLRQQVGNRRILAILEPRSNTMRMGVHVGQLADALGQADQVWVLAPPELGWDAATVLRSLGRRLHVHDSTQSIIDEVAGLSAPGDQVLIMSNGGFEGIHQRLLDALDSRG